MERRINEKIRELEERPDELYEYLAKCAPHIREYTTERTGGVQRKDIFDDYMSTVENTVTEHKKPPPIDKIGRAHV